MTLEMKDNNSIDFSYFNENNSIFDEKEKCKKEEKLNDEDNSDDSSDQESISTSFDSKSDDDEKELKLLPSNLLNIETKRNIFVIIYLFLIWIL